MIYYLLNDLKLHLLYIILDFFRPEMHYKKNIKFLYTSSDKKLLIISYPSSGWHFFKNVLLSYFNFKNLFLKKLDKKYKFSSINHSHLPIYMLPHYRFQKVICIKREPVTILFVSIEFFILTILY